MNDPVVLAGVAVVAIAAGFGVGFFARSMWASTAIRTAQDKSARILAEARAQQKELILQAKDEQVRLAREAEEDARARRNELASQEGRLRQRDEQLDQRADMLAERDRKLLTRERELDTTREELARAREEQISALEKVSQMSQEDAKQVLLEQVRVDAEHDAVRLARSIERKAKEEADAKAQKVIATAIQRYAADQSSESTVTTVNLPSDEIKGRIIGKEGRNIQSFEKATGIDVIIDDESPNTVVMSGYNPVRRQVGRIAMEKLVSDGRINPSRIEEAVKKAEKEVNSMAKKAGEDALYELKLSKINPDLTKLLGTMKFRTSYGQNILKHSVEVARIAEMLASEIGVDPTKAKLAGLFHDIGKAVSHEVEGPHAVIGHDICKKYGIPDDVAHAVGAHHEDMPMESPLDIITQVADAISGARPGARRESFEQYVKRLKELENVANAFDGVAQAYAIQAGREIRILVKPEEVDDLSTARLAKDVASKIEKELTYPGQIKVNVIRETRATELAK